MHHPEINIDKLRSYANILSKSTLERMIRNDDISYVKLKSRKYDRGLINLTKPTFHEYFYHVFSSLKHNYRNEYIYKNVIINDLLIGQFGLETTNALNEFRINKSIADLVLLNGTSKVFEIKTELDNPVRLATQIIDYKKVFQEIYIVTFHSLSDKYIDIIDDSIGILVLTDDTKLKPIRDAKINTEFDPISILKCLRKPEYTNVLIKYFGYLPEVSDVKFYRACKELFQKIPHEKLHELMLEELKKRRLKENDLLASNSIPESLKHICLSLDLDQNEYRKLTRILHRKI